MWRLGLVLAVIAITAWLAWQAATRALPAAPEIQVASSGASETSHGWKPPQRAVDSAPPKVRHLLATPKVASHIADLLSREDTSPIDLHAGEPIDIEWARAMTARVRDILNRDMERIVPGTVKLDVSCRSSSCRVLTRSYPGLEDTIAASIQVSHLTEIQTFAFGADGSMEVFLFFTEANRDLYDHAVWHAKTRAARLRGLRQYKDFTPRPSEPRGL